MKILPHVLKLQQFYDMFNINDSNNKGVLCLKMSFECVHENSIEIYPLVQIYFL